MNIVLLSGGSGKRLWPLSNGIRSKQFIKIFKKKDGTYESMVQRVYRQIRKVDTDATVTIATSKTQVSAIHNQLGEDVGISVEPCRRDTFPAIALATAYLVDVMHVDPSESVVVCPVDPYVEDDYFEALKELSEQADKCEANLVLMGIEPTYLSGKYGYIIPESSDHVAEVKTFKEKPTADVAEQYIAQGELWNGGVFAYKLGYVMNKAHELMEFADYQDLFDKYDTLKKISFDYAVLEHEPKIQVVRFAGMWKDLGTWNTLTEAMDESVIGQGEMNDKCSGVHRPSVNELMRNAKALIMCSQWYETFGMVIAEAYSCGTPVIVGDIGNIKDLVITGKTGELFTYNSPDDMISTIKRFEANSYGEYSKNAYKLFNERLTSKSNYNQLLKIYDQLG